MKPDDDPVSMFTQLPGKQLSAITFVQDYLQLWFDGLGINVLNPLTVRTSSSATTSWQPGFRDPICGQIAKIVAGVERRPGEALVVEFEDGSMLSISLRREDYTSGEAYHAHGFRNNGWMVE